MTHSNQSGHQSKEALKQRSHFRVRRMVEAAAMCVVNEGVRVTSSKRSEDDDQRTTGVNNVQGRGRVTNFVERSFPRSEVCRMQQTGCKG